MSKTLKKFTIVSIAILAILTIITSVLIYLMGCSYIKANQIADGIYVESEYYSIKVDFTEITHVDLIDTVYDNELADGMVFNNCEVGVFINDIYGEYFSFVDKSSKKSIALTIDTTRFAVNYIIIGFASKKETMKLFEYVNSNIVK